MRPGLVAVGAAFAIVGAAVIVGVLYPGDDPAVVRSSAAEVDGLTSGAWRPFVLPSTPRAPFALTLTWASNGPAPNATSDVNVSLYPAQPCPPATEPCVDPPVLASWTLRASGQWSGPGTDEPEYLLFVNAPDSRNVSINFSATFLEQYRAGTQTLPTVPLALTIVGGGLLAGVGAVALYLGLFLPSGVYDPLLGGDPGTEPEEAVDGASDDDPGPDRSP